MKAGDRVTITARRVHEQPDRFDRLLASGVIRPPDEEGDPLEAFPVVRLRRGTTAALIQSDRGEA